jgi:hypothetical protein
MAKSGDDRKKYAGPFCGAKLRQSPGKTCTNPPMENGRCRMHGGKSPPAGPTHPRYKTGRTSKYIPPELRKRYEEAYSDPDLLSIRDDVALAELRKTQLLERMADGDSKLFRTSLKDAWDAFESGNKLRTAAIAADDQPAMERAIDQVQTALKKLGSLINKGDKSESIWDELTEASRFAISAKKAEVDQQHVMAQMMSLEQVMVLMNAVQLAVVEVVKDKQQQYEIGHALAKLMNVRDRSQSAGSGVADMANLEAIEGECAESNNESL